MMPISQRRCDAQIRMWEELVIIRHEQAAKGEPMPERPKPRRVGRPRKIPKKEVE